MPLDDTTRAPRRAPKMTQADQRRWRQVREEWLKALSDHCRTGLCRAIDIASTTYGWSYGVRSRLSCHAEAYRPTGKVGYWWPLGRTLRGKGNRARLRVLNTLCGFPPTAGPNYTERKKPSRKETR